LFLSYLRCFAYAAQQSTDAIIIMIVILQSSRIVSFEGIHQRAGLVLTASLTNSQIFVEFLNVLIQDVFMVLKN